jgi:hypothetical protein
MHDLVTMNIQPKIPHNMINIQILDIVPDLVLNVEYFFKRYLTVPE